MIFVMAVTGTLCLFGGAPIIGALLLLVSFAAAAER